MKKKNICKRINVWLSPSFEEYLVRGGVGGGGKTLKFLTSVAKTALITNSHDILSGNLKLVLFWYVFYIVFCQA